MPRKTFSVTLDVRSPFIFAALEPSAHGIDSCALRMADGMPCLPGDHVRGHLRHAASVLFENQPKALEALFGTESPERVAAGSQRQDEPRRGALVVGDFVARQYRSNLTADPVNMAGRQMSLAHRVKIDPVTGAAEEGMLQVIELALPPNAIALFEGTITVRPAGPIGSVMPTDIKKTLQNLLALISHVGGLKSAGFGEIAQLQVSDKNSQASKVDVSALADSIVLDLTFDRPLLVNVDRQAFNVLVSGTVIPGAALKGALAEALNDAGELDQPDRQDALSRLRISHAFPLLEGNLADRAIPSALAIAKIGKHSAAKFCFCPEDVAALANDATPAFSGDWKGEDYDWAKGMLNRPSSTLVRQARGRVGIDDSGIAEDKKLFVTDLVETGGRSWRVVISRNGAAPEMFGKAVAAFEQGFAGLGRTGAVVTGTRAPGGIVQPANADAGRVVILLETPTVMTDHASNANYADQYSAYFSKLLGPGVTSVRAVASRRLTGDFYAFRYAARGDGAYLPFELTEAGASFEIEVDANAAEKLNAFLKSGLPPLHGGDLLTAPVTGWRQCPFMPENGYGEISLINQATMNAFAVDAGQVA